ncbi:MAG: peptide chain release factor-like protein [Deltaproteobacteria bacterium]|nr:peptide chain release factor-like protein [Deltaproteobacteria bacterium]
MGRYPVSIEKEIQLEKRMVELSIAEDEIEEKFIKGSGSGGQKINKTSSCVYLLHKPTGIEVKCQKDRSQAMNRFHARRELCDKIEQLIKGEQSKKQQEREKVRRQKRKRSKRAKEKVLKDKKITSDKKVLRKNVSKNSEH